MVTGSPLARARDVPPTAASGATWPTTMPYVRAGESTVGDERDRVAEARADDSGRRRKHLAHARAALWTFVADDDDVALAGSSVQNRREARLFRIENAGGTGDRWASSPQRSLPQLLPSPGSRSKSQGGHACKAARPGANHILVRARGASGTLLSDSATVSPGYGKRVAVKQPCASSIFITCGMPPARCRSVATYRPEGFRSQRTGMRADRLEIVKRETPPRAR